VQVADDDAREVRRYQPAREAREGALAQVEADRLVLV
jgi:hypothetical protein